MKADDPRLWEPAFKVGFRVVESAGMRGDRKPRGGPPWEVRFSFCCAKEGCRRRHTPGSVRFLGRRVYAGLIVVLVSAMLHGLNPERVQRLRKVLGIDWRTLGRWRQWWRSGGQSSRRRERQSLPAVRPDR